MNGDLVSASVPEEDLRDEVNSRTAKAGYTTRYGERTSSMKIMTTSNWGKRKLNLWPRDDEGNLIENI